MIQPVPHISEFICILYTVKPRIRNYTVVSEEYSKFLLVYNVYMNYDSF